jgi:small GTP-binding protein
MGSALRKRTSFDFKLVVLGAASVGKTSIIQQYCNNTFSADTAATVGAGFFSHTCVIKDSEVTLMIWDTAGEERFRSVAPFILKGANGLILVFDHGDPKSFDALDPFLEMFYDNVDVSHHAVAPVLLLGNKVDLGNFVIGTDLLKSWQARNRIQMYFSVSAKTGEGIREAFTELIDQLIQPRNLLEQPPPIHFVLNQEEGEKVGFCC